MPNIKSAGKRARQAIGRQKRNRSTKSLITLSRKKLDEAAATADKSKAEVLYKQFCSVLDKAAKHGIIQSNNADRRKARGAALLAKMSSPAAKA